MMLVRVGSHKMIDPKNNQESGKIFIFLALRIRRTIHKNKRYNPDKKWP